MIAIVTSESHFNKVIDANVEIRQWVLSTYYEDTLSSAVLRGMVLARRAEERGKDIFNVLNKQSSVLVLRWDQYDLRSPNDYPDIVESCNTKDNPKLRIAWIRVNNQAEFHDLTRTSLLHHFGLFVTGDIDPRHRREALLSYPDGWGDSDALNDPLRFGIKALESASCIYIPATEKDRKEIFLMNTMFTANTLARELNSVIPAVECVF